MLIRYLILNKLNTLHMNKCHRTLFDLVIDLLFQIGFLVFDVIRWHSSVNFTLKL